MHIRFAKLTQGDKSLNNHANYSSRAISIIISGPASFSLLQRACFNHTWWRHQMETFPRYWPFLRGIHRSPVNSPHKGQWRGALIFFLICVWINGWVNNGEAGDLRRYQAHYDVIVMRTNWRRHNHEKDYLHSIESMKTTSMENVLEYSIKIKNTI